MMHLLWLERKCNDRTFVFDVSRLDCLVMQVCKGKHLANVVIARQNCLQKIQAMRPEGSR